MTSVTSQAQQRNGVMESSAWRDASWGDCGRQPEMVPKWRGAANRSKHGQRWPGKLDRRWLTAAYGGQSAMVTRQIVDDVERHSPRAGGVHRQGTKVLLRADTCKQGERAWNRFAPLPSTSAVDGEVERYGRTSTSWTLAGQLSSSPTEAAWEGSAGCQRGLSFRNPAASGWETSPVTGEWMEERTDECYVAAVAHRSRQRQSLWHVTSLRRQGVGLLLVTIWLALSCLIAPAVITTTTSIILSSNKIQNGDILVPAKPGPPGKIAVKIK